MTIRKLGKFFSMVLLIVIAVSCEKDYDGYYDVPENLAGPLYEQLKANNDFSSYVEAIDKIPELQRIINKSGLYTIFAPTNSAWQTYLAEQGYSSTDDIPEQELQELVENHILFAMWYRYDFDRLISDETLTRYDKTNFEVRSRPALVDVVASEGSLDDDIGSATPGDDVKVLHNYRQVKVFTKKHLDKGSVRQDYMSIYGTDAGDFVFGTANVVTDEISAKNGVIHGIDEVIAPVNLISGYLRESQDLKEYYKIVADFMELDYSEAYSQELGQDVYTMKFVYPTGTNYTGTSNIWGTGRNTWAGNFRYAAENQEITVFAPTNESLTGFLSSKYIPDYTEPDDIPDLGKYYILGGTTYRTKAVWPSDIDGIESMTGDTILRNEVFAGPSTDIEVLSNGILYAGNFVPSKKLTTVTALCLLDKNYEWTGQAFLNILPQEEATGSTYATPLINIISGKSDADDGKYTFLTPSNEAWANYGFTFEDFKPQKPAGSLMNNLTSPKLWTIVKSHALLGEYSKEQLEAGTLPNGYYATASRLYQKYKDGKFLGYNRDVNKIDTYVPVLVEVNQGTVQTEDNGVVIGLNGILDLHINRDNSFFNHTENKKAEGDISYKPFMDKCNEVHLFEDGEIDYKDDFKTQNLTIFVLTKNAIDTYDQILANHYSALPDKSEIDSTEWMKDSWRRVLKGHFVWDSTDPLKRIFLDTDDFIGNGMYYTDGKTFYRNQPVYISYEGGEIFISRDGVEARVQVGVAVDGTPLDSGNTRAMNEQCMNAVIHLVDQALPLSGLE